MKHMGRKQILFSIGLLLLLAFSCGNLAAQTTASAALDSTQISIGDQVQLRLRADYSANGLFQRLDFSNLDSLSGIEILGVDTPRTQLAEGGAFTEQLFTITSFDPGKYEIPAMPIYVAEGNRIDTAWTTALTLVVNDVRPSVDSLHIEPIKDIIPEAYRLIDYWPYTVSALLILIVAGVLYFANRPVREEVFPKMLIQKSPHEIALAKLNALRQAQAWLPENTRKAYYADLSFVIREYLEKRFGIKALESTTTEIFRALPKSEIPENGIATLNTLLQTADMVKFAKSNPEAMAGANWLERAREFVEMTKVLEKESGDEGEGG